MSTEIIAKGQLTVLLLIAIVVVLGGCGSHESEAISGEMTFDVIDSLLGPICLIEAAGISFRPPVSCDPAPDTIQTALKRELSSRISSGRRTQVENCFADLERMTGVMVCTVDSIHDVADTGSYFADYRGVLRARFGSEHVVEGEYVVSGVSVKSYLVTDSHMVQFKLICFGIAPSAAELSYFAPANEYANLIKQIESSIGSIKPIERR